MFILLHKYSDMTITYIISNFYSMLIVKTRYVSHADHNRYQPSPDLPYSIVAQPKNCALFHKAMKLST